MGLRFERWVWLFMSAGDAMATGRAGKVNDSGLRRVCEICGLRTLGVGFMAKLLLEGVICCAPLGANRVA